MKYLTLICLVISSISTLAGTAAAHGTDNPPPTGPLLSARAMYRKALQYETAVPPNYIEAMKWFRHSAAAGNSYSMTDIGMLYGDGLGVTQNYAKALQWYRMGVATGDPLADNMMGLAYQHGEGVPQDYTKAMRWFKKAAAGGDNHAMNNIGMLYMGGLHRTSCLYCWLLAGPRPALTCGTRLKL